MNKNINNPGIVVHIGIHQILRAFNQALIIISVQPFFHHQHTSGSGGGASGCGVGSGSGGN